MLAWLVTSAAVCLFDRLRHVLRSESGAFLLLKLSILPCVLYLRQRLRDLATERRRVLLLRQMHAAA